VVEEVLDGHPPAGGEVVDDDDVVDRVLTCLQGSSQAGPAGDDVAHEEIMAVEAFRGF
jgi:hypothetical protein